MASDPFAELGRDVPDGAFWMDGARWTGLLTALTADRVRPGTNLDELPTDKGRFFNAKAGGSAAAAATPPLTVVDASDEAHPGRVRVINGRLGGLLPAEMHLIDAVLPNGTDNHCYLTLAVGNNHVYGKVLVDNDSGLFTAAHVYRTGDAETPDGTWAYLEIAQVVYDGTTVSAPYQLASGNQSLLVYCSADGTTLTPVWTAQP